MAWKFLIKKFDIARWRKEMDECSKLNPQFRGMWGMVVDREFDDDTARLAMADMAVELGYQTLSNIIRNHMVVYKKTKKKRRRRRI